MNKSLIVSLFSDLSRDEVRSIAKQANVACGKSKANTIANLEQAVANGTVRISATVAFKPKAIYGTSTTPLLRKNYYSYIRQADLTTEQKAAMVIA